MRIFALDTACATASGALMENGALVAEAAIHGTRTHSQKLLPMVTDLFARASLAPSDVDCFAVAVGPGSFTGLRIGVVTAKGLAFATGKPLVGISTLEALACTVPAWPGVVCPVIDARNRQAFCGFYRLPELPGQLPVPLAEDTVLSMDILAEQLAIFNQDVLLVGDCALTFCALIREKWQFVGHVRHITAADPAFFTTRAATTARLAALRHPDGVSGASGEPGDPLVVEPRYLRASQAEQRRYDLLPRDAAEQERR